MKKIKISLIAIVMLLMCLCAFAFSGCKPDDDEKDKKPGSVQIEVYHPNIEGKIAGGSCNMKYDGKPKVFDIKIYSVQGRKYLTNDDLVCKNRNSLIYVLIQEKKETMSTNININDPNSWPTEAGIYDIYIIFNSMKISAMNDPNYYASPSMNFILFIEEESKDD